MKSIGLSKEDKFTEEDFNSCPLNLVIGIVAEWLPNNCENPTKAWFFNVVVGWLQEANFDIIPILPWYTEKEVNKVLEVVDGILWMGGMRDLKINMDGNFEKFNSRILNQCISSKIPLLTICQGFQMLCSLVVSKNILSSFCNNGVATSDLFISDHNDKLFMEFNSVDTDFFQTKKVNFHYHEFGVKISTFNDFEQLNKDFVISSTGSDLNGDFFVNSIHHIRLPIHGVQFHPERGNTKTVHKHIGEDIPESQIISNKILHGFKGLVEEYKATKKGVYNFEAKTKLYEFSTLNILISKEYIGKVKLKGYAFHEENFPYQFK